KAEGGGREHEARAHAEHSVVDPARQRLAEEVGHHAEAGHEAGRGRDDEGVEHAGQSTGPGHACRALPPSTGSGMAKIRELHATPWAQRLLRESEIVETIMSRIALFLVTLAAVGCDSPFGDYAGEPTYELSYRCLDAGPACPGSQPCPILPLDD